MWGGSGTVVGAFPSSAVPAGKRVDTGKMTGHQTTESEHSWWAVERAQLWAVESSPIFGMHQSAVFVPLQ